MPQLPAICRTDKPVSCFNLKISLVFRMDNLFLAIHCPLSCLDNYGMIIQRRNSFPIHFVHLSGQLKKVSGLKTELLSELFRNECPD
jgi:hypothetical protein